MLLIDPGQLEAIPEHVQTQVRETASHVAAL